MLRRHALIGLAGAALAFGLSGAALAEDTVKIGLILPMTGPSASTGREIEAAVKLYMQQNGAKVAGKKIGVMTRDDTGQADITKRLAQDLVDNEKVAVIAGFGLTPLALAAGPIAGEAQVPPVLVRA